MQYRVRDSHQYHGQHLVICGGGDSALTFGMVRRHYTNPVLIRLAMAGTETLRNWDEEVGVGASLVNATLLDKTASNVRSAARSVMDRSPGSPSWSRPKGSG